MDRDYFWLNDGGLPNGLGRIFRLTRGASRGLMIAA